MGKKHSHSSPFWKVAQRLVLLVCALIAVMAVRQATQPPDWWQYALKEQITQQPVMFRDRIIVATNYGTVQAIHQRTGETVWTVPHEKDVAAQPLLKNNVLYTGYVDGIIVAIDPTDGKVIWRYVIPNEKQLFTGLLHSESQLYFGDSGGVVHSLSLRTGKEQWSLQTPNPKSVEQLVTRDGITWFGSLIYDRGKLYVLRTHGYIAELNPTNGNVHWETDLQHTLKAEQLITRTSLIVSTTQQSLISISRTTGKVVTLSTSEENVFCQTTYTPQGILSDLLRRTDQKPHRFLVPFEQERLTQVIQVESNGKVVSRSPNSGSELWKVELGFAPQKCFFDQDQHYYVTLENGQVTSIDLGLGKIAWTRAFPAKILTVSSVQKPQPLSQEMRSVRYYTQHLFVSDDQGKVHKIDPTSGTTLWSFQTDGTVVIHPVLRGTQLFIVSTNGGINRVRLASGKPDLSVNTTKVTVSPLHESVDAGQIYELSFRTASNIFHNPYTAASLSATFTSPEGKTLPAEGFFYDSNEWRIRFNPPTSGIWSWTATWNDPFGEKSFSGTFKSNRDFSFLRPAQGTKWLSQDGQHIAPITGLNDCLIDHNRDGSPLNDFSLRDGALKIATTSGNIPQTLHFTATPVELSTYLDTYKPGFNLFRLSVSNCSPPLYNAENFLSSRYLAHEGSYYDRMSQELFKRGYRVWFTLFGFSLPFDGAVRYPDERVAIQNYVKYVTARYGAYVDVWEISNEAVASEEYVRVFAQEIQKHDPYKRPITVSWDKPQMPEIALVAPHWYETEPDSESDLATIEQIRKFHNVAKPIVFGEQGNRTRNWDETSAARMRVRIWTAFFHQASLIFWNQTSNKNTYNPTFDNSNIYIGDEERQYAKNFLELTKNLPIDLVPGIDPGPELPLRSYTLRNATMLLQYSFNGRIAKERVGINNPFQVKAYVDWFDPETGRFIRRDEVAPGQSVQSPEFIRDIFAKMRTSR